MLGSTEKKLLVIFIVVTTLTIGVISAISLYTERDQGEKAGLQHNKRMTELALELMRNELSELKLLTTDYAKWQDMYAFVELPNQRFTQANFSSVALESLRLDGVAILDSQSQVIFRQGQTNNFGRIPFERHSSNGESEFSAQTISGVLFHDSGTYLFSSAPIQDGYGTMRTNGRLLFFKEVNHVLNEKVSKIIGHNFRLISISKNSHFLPITDDSIWVLNTQGQTFEDSVIVGVYSLMREDYVMPVSIELITPYQPQSLISIVYRTIPYLAALLILPSVMIYLLRSHITKPIRELIYWLNQVDGSQLAEELKPYKHADNAEMGELSEKFSSIYNNLYQQHQFSQLLLYSISDFIFTVDHKGNIDYCNPAATEWLNVSASQLYGQSFEFLISNQSTETPSPSNWLYCAIHNGREYSGISLLRKFGELSDSEWMEIQVSPMIKADDEPMGALVILRPKMNYSNG